MSNNTQIYSCNQIKRENENLRLKDMYVYVMHLSIEIPTPPPPTPGQGGGMWGIVMVFEGTVCPWGWGISQDLL